MEKLLPCPFCGGDAEIYAHSDKINEWFYPTCEGLISSDCPGVVTQDGEFMFTNSDCKSEEDALKLWNKRV